MLLSVEVSVYLKEFRFGEFYPAQFSVVPPFSAQFQVILPPRISLNKPDHFLAVQSALELTRNEKDAWNPLIAGGWTGFIFGHGISTKTN